MRLLLVSPYLPHRDIGHGGGMSTYRLAMALAREHEVTVLCFQRSDEPAGLLEDLRSAHVQVVPVPFRSGRDRGWARVLLGIDRALCAARAARGRRPYVVERYARAAMRERLVQLLEQLRPHAVQVEYQFMAPYASLARQTIRRRADLWPADSAAIGGGPEGPPVVALNTHEAGVLPRLRRMVTARGAWARGRRAWDLASWAPYEAAATTWADLVLCVTEQDRAILQGISGAQGLVTLPLGVDVHALPRVSGRCAPPRRLLFVGSFDHPPNRDAAALLVAEVLPRVRERWPDAVLDLVGRNPPRALRAAAAALPAGAATVHGFVRDLDLLFERAWLFVAPVFSGGGIKIKILEAMARGIPVVSTPFGLEGILARPGVEAAIGDSPAAVAALAVDLLGAPDELRRMGEGGRRRVAEDYSWDAIAATLVQHLAAARRAVRPVVPPDGATSS